MTTYKFRTFQELVDRVPSDRIAECLRECGLAFAQGKAMAELVFHTACSIAKDAGKDAPAMTKRVLELPDELEWIDDGKGEIKTTLSFPDNEAIICKSTTTPQ
jgi:hypothetical protein